MKNIIRKQYNHIGKRNHWAQLYARKIVDAINLPMTRQERVWIERGIRGILSEAAETLPPECIKKDVVLYSQRFDQYVHVAKKDFTTIIKELEAAGKGYYNRVEDIIVIHRPKAEETALDVARKLAPGENAHLHNDIIGNCMMFQDRGGHVRKFTRAELSRTRSEKK